ncbi:MAG TPA: endolytic transglycosylase MltG [Candidatus Saccharimonadales bacterium]|nr:endolytic transglycosylase MltG [Candidatus Saccharimonadales bacterium]
MKHSYLAGAKSRRSSGLHRLAYLGVILLVVIALGAIRVRMVYDADLKPVSSDQKTQIFNVKQGSSVKDIATDLQSAHLIRSAWAFELYVHSKELSDSLQAGTYALSPSQTTGDIATTITKGRVSSQLVTIVPGRRIDQVRADLINAGFSPDDVAKALEPAQYANLPVMAYKPANVNTLEGLLWPDSWYKDSNSDASDIIRKSLTAMGQHITPDVQAAFAAEKLTVYQGLILTSIVEQEVSRPADQTQAAQVFLTRIKNGSVLGSDASTRYGAVAAGQVPNLFYDSAYNTLKHPGLPPTPISTISANALNAVEHPARTNWLYFVTGDNGVTYFSTNLQDHEAKTQQYCHKLCREE